MKHSTITIKLENNKKTEWIKNNLETILFQLGVNYNIKTSNE